MFTLRRGGAFHSPIQAMLRRISDLSRGGVLDDLQSSGIREIERIARDNGLSTADFRALAKLGPNATDLLERRMAALDLDPSEVSEIAPQAFRDL